jgi:radical SAM superfamily enzyme YgiQ (UPF0313 family)
MHSQLVMACSFGRKYFAMQKRIVFAPVTSLIMTITMQTTRCRSVPLSHVKAFLTSTSPIATRGCHNRCGFCYLATEGLRMPYRMRDPQQIAAEFAADKQPLECATFHILTPYPATPLFRRMEAEERLLHRDWTL